MLHLREAAIVVQMSSAHASNVHTLLRTHLMRTRLTRMRMNTCKKFYHISHEK